MPLVKSGSKAARQTNIQREISAGKPIKQAVAIGYAQQRRVGGGILGNVRKPKRK